MKQILITGAGSYIGSSVETYLAQWPEQYQVDTLDMIGDGWKDHDFHGYDAVVHVAGIVHREDSKNDPGSHKDRHEKIGEGYIGIEAFESSSDDDDANSNNRNLKFIRFEGCCS